MGGTLSGDVGPSNVTPPQPKRKFRSVDEDNDSIVDHTLVPKEHLQPFEGIAHMFDNYALEASNEPLVVYTCQNDNNFDEWHKRPLSTSTNPNWSWKGLQRYRITLSGNCRYFPLALPDKLKKRQIDYNEILLAPGTTYTQTGTDGTDVLVSASLGESAMNVFHKALDLHNTPLYNTLTYRQRLHAYYLSFQISLQKLLQHDMAKAYERASKESVNPEFRKEALRVLPNINKIQKDMIDYYSYTYPMGRSAIVKSWYSPPVPAFAEARSQKKIKTAAIFY